MTSILVLPLTLLFLFPAKSNEQKTYRVSSVCERFATGKIDAFKTLEALDLKIENYSIGINNSAKIFCA